MFRKKFKVRVNCGNVGSKSCKVEYAHYRFTPNWVALNCWLIHTKTVIMYKSCPKKAEEFAKQFTSIDTVHDYEKKLAQLTYSEDMIYTTKTIISK